MKSTSKFRNYLLNNIKPAFLKFWIHMALSEGSFWFAWHLWKSKIFCIIPLFILRRERSFKICYLSWLQDQYYLILIFRSVQTPVKRKRTRFMSKGVLRERAWFKHVKITKGCNYLVHKGTLSKVLQSGTSVSHLAVPWNSFHINQGTVKEESEWHISGSPSNKNLGGVWGMIPDCLATKHPQKICSWKDCRVLGVIQSMKSQPPKATTLHHCIGLNGANVLYQL